MTHVHVADGFFWIAKILLTESNRRVILGSVMTKVGLSVEQLRSIPLLRAFGDSTMDQVAALFERVDAKRGDVLFEADKPAEYLYLLASGEISLYQADQETHRLRPPSLIGELGALTGQLRTSRAILNGDSEVWRLSGKTLRGFLSKEQREGLRFMESLLEIVADKVRRDQTRMQDMRGNLIRTQKAMKQMRTFLLESQDTVVSKPLHEILDGLIRQNRRANYRVRPPQSLPSTAKLDGGTAEVVQISRTHISFLCTGRNVPTENTHISGVLTLSGPEIPFSGRILRTIENRVDVELDLLMDEYIAILEGYLTRVQLLDLLV